jgi:hypothetical protein|uniref:Tail protein n=1 Tax=virus sp. ctmTa7 TaxID=2828255 RepID=A0A8S5RCE0_9VIRU|nr:MAG TPA: tail protein [virus sp. ctmTa7]
MENLINDINGLKVIHNMIQDYTIVLSSRDLRHLGQITGIQNVNLNKNLNSADEISFTISKFKMIDNKYKNVKESLWNQIIDLKLIWVKELNEYFEINVRTEDSSDTVKNITGTSLCEAELGQTMLYNTEINTENDIARDDYDANYPTTFYREDHPEASLLHRILEKAPHYTIKYVDESLKNLSFIRQFTIDGTSIYDFLTGECSEQYNCLFDFNSADRSISVYDLYTTCNDCGYRGDYYDKCPKCESTNLKYFGEDTTILVDKTNLTDSITLEADVSSIKNSFKLVAGDDYMTATIRMLNQNGSDYIYYFSDEQKSDMSSELVQKLNDYDKLYNSKTDEYQKYVSTIYDQTDKILNLTSEKMPTIEESPITAETEAAKLTVDNLSPTALTELTESTSVETVNSALKNYAKVYIKSGYVKIETNNDAAFSYNGKHDDGFIYGTWTGSFTITNYSDSEDVKATEKLTIQINDNYEEFIKQKVLKQVAQMDENEDEKGSIFDVLNIEDLDKFKDALKLYCKNRLTSFYDAIQGALDVLVQMDQATESADLYESMYIPYYNKLQACQEAINSIQTEIDQAQKELNEAQDNVTRIQKELNFKDFLGDLYVTFCAYRREDEYSNENYISDGLDNADMLKHANEFIETAKNELIKSSEKQWTLSSTLYNLLILPEFKPIIKYFKLGNWIRLKVDNQLFKLRLISYSLDFNSLDSLSVEFSNVSKIKSVAFDAQQIIQSAKSMASSYGYVSKQADKGSNAQNDIESWKQSGLDSGLIQIKNGKNEEITYGKNGLLCRAYDDITGTYSDDQLKLVHNAIAFTDNNWKSVKQMIGNHNYMVYDKESESWGEKTGYGNTAEFVTAGHVSGSTIVGGEIYSHNYSNKSGEEKGTYIDLANGSFSFAGGGFTYDGKDSLVLRTSAIEDAIKDVGVTAKNLHVKAQNIDTMDGKIKSDQIDSITVSQISDPDNFNIGSVNAENINGKIKSDQIESIDAIKINGNIDASKITGTNNNLIDTVESSKISTILENKTLSNTSITGTLSLNNTDGTTVTGLSGDYQIGDKMLKIINGIIVSIT